MDFFLNVGVYALIVVLTAVGAGLIAFRLLTGGGFTARGGSLKQSHGRASTSDDAAEGDDWAERPAAATQPRAQASGHEVVPAVSPVPASSPASGPAASGRALGVATAAEPGTAAALQSFQTAIAQENASSGKSGVAGANDSAGKTGAVPANVRVAPATQVEPPATDSAPSVIAPPDELNGDDSDNDSILSMFQGGDEEESTVGDLAERLEDVDTSFLLSTAMEIVVTSRGKGGSDA